MFLFRKIGQKTGLYTASLVIVASVLMQAAPVFAQTAQAPQATQTPARPPLNLMTSPLPLNVITKPGQTVTADLRVKNNGTRPEVLKVELLKFGASGDTGRPQLQEREPTDQYFNWISFSENSFTADPNVWKTVKMTIKAPKEAAFGYYFAVLFSRAVPDKPTGNQSAVEGGVASLVLLNVDAPGARREAKIAELVATQKVYEFLPAKLTVRLRNSGNVHVSPVGTVFIKRGDAQVATINFNDERGNILPGTNRVFDMDWGDGFPAYVTQGTGESATRSLEWDFSKIQKLRFGKYTATLVAVYDDGQRDVPIEAVVSFWVIPWRILGVILLIVLFIGAGIWGITRLIWKNVRRRVTAPAATSQEPDPSSLAAATKKRPKKVEKIQKAQKVQAGHRVLKRQKAVPLPEVIDKPVYEEEAVRAPRIRKAPTPRKAAPEPKPAPEIIEELTEAVIAKPAPKKPAKPVPKRATAAKKPAAQATKSATVPKPAKPAKKVTKPAKKPKPKDA